VETLDVDSRALQLSHGGCDVTRVDEAGVGDQKGPAKAKRPGELSKPIERASSEDDARAGLKIEWRHGLQ
jgi:hypothetical protein